MGSVLGKKRFTRPLFALKALPCYSPVRILYVVNKYKTTPVKKSKLPRPIGAGGFLTPYSFFARPTLGRAGGLANSYRLSTAIVILMIARTLKHLRSPVVRFWCATGLFIVSLIAGAWCTLYVSQTPYEKVLMAISWGAITITCLDIMATTDTRKELDK